MVARWVSIWVALPTRYNCQVKLIFAKKQECSPVFDASQIPGGTKTHGGGCPKNYRENQEIFVDSKMEN